MPSIMEVGALEGVGEDVHPPETAERLDKEPKTEGEEPEQGPRNVLSIPSKMWNSVKDELTLFIDSELNECEGERGAMMEKFSRWREAYIAPMADGPKNFPIHNSSNITAALIKEHVHTIVGQLVQSTTANRPYFMLKDLAWEWEEYVDELERFLDLAAHRDMDYKQACIDAIIEAAILGTAIVEVSYEVDERRVYKYTADGKSVYPSSIIRKDGPVARHIPIGSFWIRMGERNTEDARWCAKRLLFSEMDLKEREAQKKFFGVDKIRQHYKNLQEQEAKDRQHEDDLLDQTSYMPDRTEIFEIFISFDVDGDGRYEELRLYYHRASRTFIGREFLPNWSGHRGFVKMGYFPRTDRFFDEGIAEMLEQIQLAVSAIVNKRADNATLANLKMILKKKIVKGLQPGDPLYSGKQIEVNDIWNDMREFSLSDIYPSTINEEHILRGMADRLTGMNEAAAGAAMPVSRTTAAAQLALLQEQRNRIGLTVESIRDMQKEMGQLGFHLYNQHGTNSKGLLWMGEKGRIVDAIFRMPRRVKELIQAIEITTPSSAINRAVKRENAVAMFNLLVSLYEKLLPLAQHLAPDSLSEVARGMVKSAKHFMGDVLESFDVSDPDDVLEGIVVLERLLPAPENLGGMESYDRREESAQSLARLSRLEDVLREAEAARSRDDRVPSGGERPRRTAPPERNGRGSSGLEFLGGESLFRSR